MKIKDVRGLADFLDFEKVMALTVPIDDKGTMHSAALLYAHTLYPVEFFSISSLETEKGKLLKDNPVQGAAVIGLHKGVGFTLQMRGEVSFKNLDDAKTELDVFEKKTGKRMDSLPTEDDVLIIFKPTWARVTDYVLEEASDGLKKHQLQV